MSLLQKMDHRLAGVRLGRMAIGVSVALLQLVIYQLMMQYNVARLADTNIWDIEITLDRNIPLLPEFAYFYFLYIPGLIVPALMDMPMHLFVRYASSLLLCLLISSLGFAFFPLRLEHEPFSCYNIGCAGLALLREVDPGVNLLPSLHASQTLLAGLVLYTANKQFKVRTHWWMWSLMLYLPVISSTLFTKQHYIIDLFAGFLLALLVWKITDIALSDQLEEA